MRWGPSRLMPNNLPGRPRRIAAGLARPRSSIMFAAPAGLGAILAFAVSAAAEAMEWKSAHFTDHSLVGSVWTGNGRRATLEEVEERAAGADFVLLGEIHPNPDHHLIQARILQAMVAAGRRPALVLEMVPRRFQAELDRIQAARPANAEDLGKQLEWEKRGWPQWSIYRPVAEVALAAGLRLVAGDLDRDKIRMIGREGRSALDEAEQAGLHLDRALPEPLNERVREILRQSHCNLLPEAAIGPMVLVQRARDGAMASSMLAAVAKGADGAVLISGAGHARSDVAVPRILRTENPDAVILSVGMLEVDPDETDPAQYGRLDLHDFVLFTPRSELKDHCAELAERMKSGQ